MAITLQVSSAHNQLMGADATKVFDSGGSIGRAAGNDWVLPDPDRVISGQHAVIVRQDDMFLLVDHSTNGTLVNGKQIHKGVQLVLSDADVICIGGIEITVTLSDNSIEDLAGGGIATELESASTGPAETTLDPLEILGVEAQQPADLIDSIATQPDDVPVANEFFAPPDPIAPQPIAPQQSAGPTGTQEVVPPSPSGPVGIPDDWFNSPEPATPADLPPAAAAPTPVVPAAPVAEQRSASQGHPPEAPVVSPDITTPPPATPSPEAGLPRQAQGGGGDLAAILRGSGIDPTEVDPQVLDALGPILRIVVSGMIDVLRGRAEIKNQFRVPMTMLKSRDNNPLKLATTVEDALEKLFLQAGKGYQDPTDAFTEGFQDIKNHQVAMLVGMRAGYRALINRFDPDALEETFDRGAKKGLLDIVNKTRYWDQYRQMYEELGDEDKSFRIVFGDEFAEAYERQMAQMEARRRKS